MAGAHRKQTRREARRAMERRQRLSFDKRKVAVTAGAVFASASIGLAPAVAQAEQINAAQNAEHDYSTWNNLIIVADELGKTHGAILAPIGSVAPDGALPTSNSNRTSDSQDLTFIDGIGEGVSKLVKQPNTGHVPGAGGVLGAGSLVAMLPQGLAAVPVATAAAQSATILPKSAATIAALTGLDATTGTKNLAALAGGLLGDKVTQQGGYALQALNIGDDPLGLLGLPDVHRQTDSWNSSYDWPALQINGNTWMVQDRITVDPVTSEELKKKYADRIGTLDTLEVQKGYTDVSVEFVDEWHCVILPIIGERCTWIAVPHDTSTWIAETDENGNPIFETIHDPNTGIPGALANLDGIDIPGFSILTREAGGEYNFLGDGSLGWLASTTQVIVGDQVTTIPVLASGIALPFGLLTTGGMYSPGLVTQNGQTTTAALGTRSQGLSIPALGIGVDTTSILESWQIGPDGTAYNSGWTIGLLNAGAGVPIPVVYSLGSFNLGAKGVGYTSPSIFGVGLPSFQLGEAPAGSAADGDILASLTGALGSSIPTSLIVLDPKLLFELANVTDPTGLGLTDPFGTTQKLLSPAFTALITPGATVVAQALADSGTKLANKASKQRETTSGLAGVTTKVGSTAEKASEKAVDGLDKISSATPPQDEYPPITVDGPSTQESLNNNPIEYNPGNPEGSTATGTSTNQVETPADSTGSENLGGDETDAEVTSELE